MVSADQELLLFISIDESGNLRSLAAFCQLRT
jgi:hypothetical protein